MALKSEVVEIAISRYIGNEKVVSLGPLQQGVEHVAAQVDA